MASGTLTIGGQQVDAGISHLAKFAKQAVSMVLKGKLENLLSQPVSSLPAGENGFQEALSFTPGTTWNLPDLPLNLTINTKASADVAIVTSGELFRFTSGLTEPQLVSVKAPGGSAYVKIKFDVAVDGNLAAQANLATTVGINGSAQAGVAYTIEYFKQVSLGATIQDALIQTVRSFPLPFHGGTLKQLGLGDYLHYTFAGNLALGFGVTYGVSRSFLSGRSVQEVQASFKSGIVAGSLSAAPTLTVGAGLDLTYKHSDFFEMLLHRDPDPASDKVSVHLLRADKNNIGLAVRAAIAVDPGANFNITSNLNTVVNQIGAHVTGKESGADNGTKAVAAKLFNSAGSEVQNFVADANQQVNNLLQKANDRGVELQAIIETQTSRVSLLDYTFHMNNANVDQAWQSAVRCDFVAAYRTPGNAVELDPGSGVEQEFIRRSSVSLNFFSLFQAGSVQQFFKSSTVVYSGNGVFNLLYTTGVEWDTASHGSSSAAGISFCAAVADNLQNMQSPQITMRFRLTDTAKAEAAGLSAQLLTDANMPEIRSAASQAMSFAKMFPQGTLVVQAELLPSAYARIRASSFAGKNPPPLPQADDGNNFSQFVAACRDLSPTDFFGGFPDVCDTFAKWQELNLSTNQIQPPPNRQLFKNTEAPVSWSAGDAGRFHIIFNYIDAARRFMNLCDDLRQLAGMQQLVATPEQFQNVVSTLVFMVKNDADVWFTKPTLLALLLLLSGKANNVQVSRGSTGRAAQMIVSFQVQ